MSNLGESDARESDRDDVSWCSESQLSVGSPHSYPERGDRLSRESCEFALLDVGESAGFETFSGRPAGCGKRQHLHSFLFFKDFLNEK
jgi:hypothetical protein